MSMSLYEVVDEFLATADPDEIPLEYIIRAKVTDVWGRSRIVMGKESLARVLRGPERKKLVEAQLYLDERRIRYDIAQGVDNLMEAVGHMIDEESNKNTDN